VCVTLNAALPLFVCELFCLHDTAQVKGIKGASILAAHRHFNLSTGAVIDVMHCVYLGVIEKTVMTLWLDVKHRSAHSLQVKY
jgi:hypothetical protein